MEDGRLVEKGTHEEDVRAGGTYGDDVRAQVDGPAAAAM
jgi:hypothetical protein